MRRPLLPLELVEEIIEQAWLSCIDERSPPNGHEDADGSRNIRWKIFQTFSYVCKEWQRVIIEAAFRHVVLQCNFDLQMYCRIKVRDTDQEEVELTLLRIEALKKPCELSLSAELLRELSTDPVSTCDMILPIVPRCRSVVVSFHPDRPSPSFPGEWHDFLQLLARMPMLASVAILWTNREWIARFHLPDTLVPAVKHLFLSYYPHCTLAHRHVSGDPHLETCFTHHVLARFPGIETLHMESACYLKLLPFPDTLQLLTLDVLPSQKPRPSMMGWNIGAALRGGRLANPDETSPPRRVIVRTGLGEPAGWAQEQTACDAHGVILQRDMVFVD